MISFYSIVSCHLLFMNKVCKVVLKSNFGNSNIWNPFESLSIPAVSATAPCMPCYLWLCIRYQIWKLIVEILWGMYVLYSSNRTLVVSTKFLGSLSIQYHLSSVSGLRFFGLLRWFAAWMIFDAFLKIWVFLYLLKHLFFSKIIVLDYIVYLFCYFHSHAIS